MFNNTNPDISIITCTVRPEGLNLVEKALKRQDFNNFEWIVQERVKPLDKEKVWSLNEDYNLAIKKAKGKLIISWQDWTYSPFDTISRFWQHYLDEPHTIVGAVGNKYDDDTFTAMTWKDPRERNDQGTYYSCYPSDIEANLCSWPKAALYDVGGFDEDMDTKYGMDAYSVHDRLNIKGGWDFKLDQSIKTYSLEHGRLSKDWDEKNWLGTKYDAHRISYLVNPVLPYLK